MNHESTQLHDFRPTASLKNLQLRAAMLRRLRGFFDARGFLEVETPILSADTVVDRHLDPFSVEVDSGQWSVAGIQGARAKDESGGTSSCGPHPNPLPKGEGTGGTSSSGHHPGPLMMEEGTGRRLWLQTSPEFHMKRLLAAGCGRMYQVSRVFRMDEVGPLHNPEFTLVEWYQPGEGLDEGMQLTSDLCQAVLEGCDAGVSPAGASAPAQPRECNADGTRRVPATLAAERVSYRDAFERYVGIDPLAIDGAELVANVRERGISVPASLDPTDRDGWLDLLMVELVQPHLGINQPTLFYDYPASQAALARVSPDDPRVAERFELYINGVELANGYHELLDPAELRERNVRTNAQRVADGKEALPVESRLLDAMEAGLPASVGVALGFDRLVMLAAGAHSIAEVVAFPFGRA